MKQKIYQIDAFTDKIFSGNPAAVCPLEMWLSNELMQEIAIENNLAETAFYVKHDNFYEIRWFTPAAEVELCGHATLASAFAIFNLENYQKQTIHFFSPQSGDLFVQKKGDLLTLNFPTDQIQQVEINDAMKSAFDIEPKIVFRGKTDYMFVFENEIQIKSIKPNLQNIAQLDAKGLIITAKGNEADFVSRFFAPQLKIDEDPVTGSAHTTLTPYWSKVLNKTEMEAIQLSERKGFLHCKYLGERVEISGKAKLYMIGEIFID